MLTNEQIENNKKEYIEIFTKKIKRQGSLDLLEFLKKSDFFVAPASTKYHSAFEGGLCSHSLFVYQRLCELLRNEKILKIDQESIAICGLLHDVCKINYYKTDMKNVKINGEWQQQPYYLVDDQLPYGHGEKSVYIINGFLKLTREEAVAINWHMGWSDVRSNNGNLIGSAYNKFPLATFLHVADVLATYINENNDLK